MYSTLRRPDNQAVHLEQRLGVKQRIEACRACSLCWNGNGPVPYYGPSPNDVMLLGEAPHRASDRKRKIVHVGEPGQLLTRALRGAGFNIDDLFICETVSCWTEGKSPTVGQMNACAPNVKAMVQLCDPRVVLACGATALKATTDRRKIKLTEVHGRPFFVRAGPFMDRWVFPTFHPAASLKSRKAELDFLADVALFGVWYRDMMVANWPEGGVD